MSLILDALRKLELERKAKRQGGIDLRPDVLSYRGTPQKSSLGRRLFLAGAVLLLIAGVSAVIFLRGGKPDSLTGTVPPEPVRVTAQEQQPLSPAPAPLPQPPATTGTDRVRPAAPIRPALHEQAAPTGETGAENITVSGIAWQDERSLRRAVVNGSLVAEGAEIMGALILEIKENRVRFSRNGQVFEVLYPSAAGR